MVPLDTAALNTLVLDTTALFPLLVLAYAKHTGAALARRNQLLRDASPGTDLVTPQEWERWLALFGHAPRRLTTAYVVAELYGLANRVLRQSDECSRFWQLSVGFLLENRVEERAYPLASIQDWPTIAAVHPRIGPADASLILLAMQEGLNWNQTRGVLVTADGRTLHREALHLRLRSVLLQELLRERE